jgi:hypothetical protein
MESDSEPDDGQIPMMSMSESESKIEDEEMLMTDLNSGQSNHNEMMVISRPDAIVINVSLCVQPENVKIF